MAVNIHNFGPTEAALKKEMAKIPQDVSVVAENPVKDYTFDLYNETVTCEMLLGIKQDDFDEVAEGIIDELSIPAKHHKAIKSIKKRGKSTKKVDDFYFDKGKDSRFYYVHLVSLIGDDNTINLAYSALSIKFKFSPKEIKKDQQTNKFLWFVTSTKSVTNYEHRNLSDPQAKGLENYFKRKAILGFKEEYPS